MSYNILISQHLLLQLQYNQWGLNIKTPMSHQLNMESLNFTNIVKNFYAQASCIFSFEAQRAIAQTPSQIISIKAVIEVLNFFYSAALRGMDKGTAKDFFSHFSGQRESNSEFTVGRLFVSILKKWENHRHIASPSLQTLGTDTDIILK